MRPAGLRSRITALFALGALGVCTALGLVDVRADQADAARRARADGGAGRLLRRGSRAGRADGGRPRHRRRCCAGSTPGPPAAGCSGATAPGTPARAEPGHRRRGARRAAGARRWTGTAGRQRSRLDGRTVLVTMVPLPAVEATYYEVNDLGELQRTLGSLRIALVVAALATAAGGAAIGRWASAAGPAPARLGRAGGRRASPRATSATRLDEVREPDVRRLTTAFNGMVDDLSARLERDRRFAADVSHELRSPLQTLSAAAEVLERRRGSLDERSAAAVGLVTKEVEQVPAAGQRPARARQGRAAPDARGAGRRRARARRGAGARGAGGGDGRPGRAGRRPPAAGRC